MKTPRLVIAPSVSVWKNGDLIIFDRKFYDGVLLYTKMWQGDVFCVMNLAESELPSFGLVQKRKDELPFKCTLLEENEKINIHHLDGASVVMASGDSFKQFHLSKLCRKIGAKCIYVIEYIPETRYQIASFSTKNPLIKFRRFLYVWREERKRLSSFSLADGLQANGMPAYYEYNKFKNILLYFDTRVDKNIIINDEHLNQRLTYLSKNKPLRLAFSGRLIRMKGVDHLLKVAMCLKQRNLNFQLTIYGTGELENEMKRFIKKHQLEDSVIMAGAVDFQQELLPNLQKNFDLFLMLHRQSDPSCTYLETLSCGLPIVSYDNNAFSGLLDLADIGWKVKMDDVNGVARVIENLHFNRKEIVEKSQNSMKFALNHNFESTFQNRIDHLSCSGLA
jgi:colanic acid/amylovoran biosynthesis glycosyltransferase